MVLLVLGDGGTARSNGDERNERTLERVEAKLNALGEEMRGIRRLLQALTDRVLVQGQEIAVHGQRLDDLETGLRSLRGETHDGLRTLRDEMREGMRSLRDEMHVGFERARQDLELRLAKFRVDIGAARIDAIEEQLTELRRRLEPSPGE
jgi:chromosome segregation ATPase